MQIKSATGQQQSNGHSSRGKTYHHTKRLKGAALDALRLSGAKVLRGKAGHGRTKAVERCGYQIGQLIGRAKAVLRSAGNHHTIQHIKLHHNALHNDNANRQHRKLQPQRNPLHHMTSHIPPRDAPVLPVEPDVRILGKGIDKASDRADQLRADRGNGRTGHPPVEHNNEQQIQSHIQYRGKQQKQQRRNRITHAAQKRADKVIEQLRTNSRKDDKAIGICGMVNLRIIRGNIDPCQHWIQQQKCCRSQQYGKRGRKNDLCGQRPTHPHMVAAAYTT